MTNVITRYFESADQARAVRSELVRQQQFSPKILTVIENADALAAEHVEADTAKVYASRLAKGGAVLVVRAGYKPLGVARIFRQVTADMGAADIGGLAQEAKVKDDPAAQKRSILSDHPYILSRPRDPEDTNYHMADWPIPLISRRKPFDDIGFDRHARMADWPLPLISKRKPNTESFIKPHGRMANFPIPLISKRKPYSESAIPRHGRMADWPIPLISKRKPYTGSAIGKHPRMANWPFPHLINGKTGTNAIIPKGPRMANFPIPLLSKREPSSPSIFPRHARMANFPIPLLSKRKPNTASAIKPHQRMANFPLPLVVKGSGDPAKDKGTGFSFSKMFGWPTLTQR